MSQGQADGCVDYFFPTFNLGLEVNETLARGFQRLLGNFMYDRTLAFDTVDGHNEHWSAFEKAARILNSTSGGFEMSTTEDDVERCRKVNSIMVDGNNGI